MKTCFVDVDGKWGIILVWDFDFMDSDELAAMMDSFGLDDMDIRKSIRILFEGNSAMTVSRSGIRMSIVFIGPVSSNSQFWNSLSHELNHVNNAIIDYYNEPYDSEPTAYLNGYLFQRVVEEIAPPCY